MPQQSFGLVIRLMRPYIFRIEDFFSPKDKQKSASEDDLLVCGIANRFTSKGSLALPFTSNSADLSWLKQFPQIPALFDFLVPKKWSDLFFEQAVLFLQRFLILSGLCTDMTLSSQFLSLSLWDKRNHANSKCWPISRYMYSINFGGEGFGLLEIRQ